MDVFAERARLIEDSERSTKECLQKNQDLSRSHIEALREWRKNRSEAERELGDRIYDLNERFFTDLRFEEPLEEDVNDDPITPELDEDPLENTRYKMDPDLECHGEYDPFLDLLTFHPDHLDDPTVLHETIHIYENFYDRNRLMKDFWITRLYSHLSPKIKGLDGYCVQFGLMRGGTLEEVGGIHGIFFLLKSLDLDIRLGLQLGTVLGYKGFLTFS
jgi:hypothetical protein